MATIFSGRDIVVVGQQPWDTEIGSNCKDIALQFSRRHRVLYINAPLDRNTVLRGRKQPAVQQRLRVVHGEIPGLEPVADNLWVLTPDCILESINWLPAALAGLHARLTKLNSQRFAKAIQQGILALNFQDFVLFNDNDIFRSFHLKELLRPELSIYYLRDYVVSVGYWKKHGVRMEPAIIAKSDLCLSNSSYLTNYCLRYNPHSVEVGQGCDEALLEPHLSLTRPAELRSFTGPIIGYVGALVESRLDIGLLRYLAEQRPQWNIVLVGPEDEAFKKSSLHKLPNVHFLGLKPTSQLPTYVQHFDVCLNPQLVNLLTIGNYPRKVDEYLALGKPVVATRTEGMGVFKDHTYLADTKEEHLALIEQALAEDSPARQQQRHDFAATHSWPRNIDRIYQAIEAYYVQRDSPYPVAGAQQPATPTSQPLVFTSAE